MRRTYLAAPLASLVLAATLAACVPIKAGPEGRSLPFGAAHPVAQELYYLVNNERAAHGLGGLSWNDQLGAMAQGWSDHMAATGSLGHQDLGAILRSPGYGHFSTLSENVIKGWCGMSAWEIHRAWMESPPHRANILGNFNAIGIGMACNGGSLYATEDFAR
jgi:uncharacterized protein YkwD